MRAASILFSNKRITVYARLANQRPLLPHLARQQRALLFTSRRQKSRQPPTFGRGLPCDFYQNKFIGFNYPESTRPKSTHAGVVRTQPTGAPGIQNPTDAPNTADAPSTTDAPNTAEHRARQTHRARRAIGCDICDRVKTGTVCVRIVWLMKIM